MILQELCKYYERIPNVPPPGATWRKIPFLVVINKEGEFVDIESTWDDSGKAKDFLVPVASLRTSGTKPNLLWDKPDYVFGVGPKNKEKRNKERNDSFINLIEIFFNEEDVAEKVKPLINFLKNSPTEKIEKKASINKEIKNKWIEIKNGSEICFRIIEYSDDLCSVLKVFWLKHWLTYWLGNETTSSLKEAEKQICLITGIKNNIVRIHPGIKGIGGNQPKIISFDKNTPSYNSYQKEEGSNAPVSEEAVFKYVTALNTLTEEGSINTTRLEDTRLVFWSDEKTVFESSFSALFGNNSTEKEDFSKIFNFETKNNPNKNIRAIKNLYSSIYAGRLLKEETSNNFYILGLSAPTKGRACIRLWKTGKVSEFSRHIKQYFDDIKIIGYENINGYFQLYKILNELFIKTGNKDKTLKDKKDKIPSKISRDIINSSITEDMFPIVMLQRAIQRIRAVQDVSVIRAGVLKAYLNRYVRIQKNPEKLLNIALDEENTNAAYCFGRIFAVLGKVQEYINPKLDAPIRNRFYGGASITPVRVFPHLMKLATHHLSKLRKKNRGLMTLREKLLDIIFQKFTALNERAKPLTLDDQARFAIGYYHQVQSFYYDDYLEEQEKNMALNKEEKNIGYLLGRLFGILEEIQKEASGDLNATIKDRFFSAAMETPKRIFPELRKLSEHHLKKIKTYKKDGFNKTIDNIINNISIENVPSTLSIEDQWNFIVGYHHQRKN
ncbi:MAG: type I-C CRISPR-associated protein Cas8c/Csd1 [Limisphaerales bacterium]|jgi:CRISPR-associated protein Csd1